MNERLKHNQLTITSNTQDEALSVSIKTPEFHIRSVCKKDKELFKEQKKLEEWCKLWNQFSPYSAFLIFNKKSNAFAGHIILSQIDNSNAAELRYEFNPLFEMKCTAEIISAVLNHYLPYIFARGYQPNDCHLDTVVLVTNANDKTIPLQSLKTLGLSYTQTNAQQNVYTACIEELISDLATDITNSCKMDLMQTRLFRPELNFKSLTTELENEKCLLTLAKYTEDKWGHMRHNPGIVYRLNAIRALAPKAYGAYYGSQLIGMFALKGNWLTYVYIFENMRGFGFGKQILAKAKSLAYDQGFKDLQLSTLTPRLDRYYLKDQKETAIHENYDYLKHEGYLTSTPAETLSITL